MKNKKNASSTILVIVLGFTLLFLLFGNIWLQYIAFGIGLLGVLSIKIGLLIEKFWFGLAKILGHIIPTVLMTVIFYVFLFPIALVSRIFNKDPLLLSNEHNSYFKTINKKFEKEDFEKIW
jgi:phosphoglycerol transferase MdoB-like AlkP superfamily enzyme